MNKKGFTLVEILVATALGTGLVVAALSVPKAVGHAMKDFNQVVERRVSLQDLTSLIKSDIMSARGDVRYDGEYLILGTAQYSFTEEGVYRHIKGKSFKISSTKFTATKTTNGIQLTSKDDNPNDKITLKFNTKFSSFVEGVDSN